MIESQDLELIRRVTRHTDAEHVAEAAYRQLDDLLRTLDDRDWTAPTACPGWSVSDMVGHLIGAARGNATLREYTRQQLWGLRHRHEFGGNPLDAVNALHVREHAHLPASRRADVLRALVPDAIRGRLRLSAWVGRVSIPISSGGSAAAGMPRTVNLGRLLDVVYTRDVWMHTMDIAEAVGRDLPFTSAVNGRLVQDVVVDWVQRHGRPVELVLTGPAGGRYRWGSDGTVIDLDAMVFCRTLSGRVQGDGLLNVKILF
ncbi:MAG TPA: maleylpyruvate isomerase family mycothiol-dependent enzyme [Nocardioides sp.]|uniref:maleylpyruvate isomerase family mycothiol-dependent enzyme n=1 Tax=Nocardioides sp. TaxID=35761 RepID=UPI002F3E3317